MASKSRPPRILIVTPEITYLPEEMGPLAPFLRAKAGGLADVSASLVAALFDLGADVHVALPHYRQMFQVDAGNLIGEELRLIQRKLSRDRIHLAEDRIFYYRDAVYGNYEGENPRLALAFQREVINNILPSVDPDLVHCNDWMTGLIPARARRLHIPSLFTVHNIYTQAVTLETIEEAGIDAARFWEHLFFRWPPSRYEGTRSSNPVDFLASGIFAAHFINTVSPTFLREIVDGRHDFVPPHVQRELANKFEAGCAAGILNAPDPSYDPRTDIHLARQYDADTHREARKVNKLALQRLVGLDEDAEAPLFIWPSRLDAVQKGSPLLAEILPSLAHDYRGRGLQVAILSHGPFWDRFAGIIRDHGLKRQVAMCEFREETHRLGFGGADFVLMPSLYEPCGLPQMIGALYGALPVVRDTGGLHDTISPLDAEAGRGNGFVFETYDGGGLRWAIDRAMEFYELPDAVRTAEVSRVMRESAARFTHTATAGRYIALYEDMLQRPLVD